MNKLVALALLAATLGLPTALAPVPVGAQRCATPPVNTLIAAEAAVSRPAGNSPSELRVTIVSGSSAPRCSSRSASARTRWGSAESYSPRLV